MKKTQFIIFFLLTAISGNCQTFTKYLKNNYSPDYPALINHYKILSQAFPEAKLIEYGLTDCGKPLHVFVISKNKIFDPIKIKNKGMAVMMVLNGIHPGEPDGINASLALADTILHSIHLNNLLDKVVLCIIPVYNIDGMLQRGCCSRVNQEGPEEYGFRGNGRNLDLNRDFIKADATNTRSFIRIFRQWDPEVFIDTHVSNGADYQYTLTLIATQHNKLEQPLGSFLLKEMLPGITALLEKKNIDWIPYVHTISEIPDNGIAGFLDSPRFATGYASLFNTLSLITETHMLKPFSQRVEHTFQFLYSTLQFSSEHYQSILFNRAKAKESVKSKTIFPVSWELDTLKFDSIFFNGYTAEAKISPVTEMNQIVYNRERPFIKKIRYYNEYEQTQSVQKPTYYIIPQAWRELIELFQINGIKVSRMDKDTSIICTVYRFENIKYSDRPYEGHFLVNDFDMQVTSEKINFYAGDYKIITDQETNRYIVETLEPKSMDSFLRWGFFNSIFQQKEWYSDYVFDAIADSILKADNQLKLNFELKKKSDPAFRNNKYAMLNYIYSQSAYFEKSYCRYPIFRVEP